ncbi:MAG: S-layer homology domain-containing protein [Dethiosulfatibacter sp.]|nr:S-layer homology domain-containing protein [Dethiosulfatibacter sp.]
MTKMKYIALFIILILFTSTIAYAVGFSDVGGYPWAEGAINDMVSLGHIKGYEGGVYMPSKELTRAELITIINRMNSLTEVKDVVFSDLTESHWAYEEIKKASSKGYISGFPDNTFRPDQPVTREQFSTIINNLYELDEELQIGSVADGHLIADWSKIAIDRVLANSIMQGYPDGTFRSTGKITRAEGAVALYNLIKSGLTIRETVLSGNTGDSASNDGGLPDEDISEEEQLIIDHLKSVVTKMKSRVIPILTTDLQIQSAIIIVDSIQQYLDDPDYDISRDVDEAKELATHMSVDEKQAFKNAITGNILLKELVTLNNKFQLLEY